MRGGERFKYVTTLWYLHSSRIVPNILEMSRAIESAAAEHHVRSPSEDAGLLRRSWHAMGDILSPFSTTALAALPKNPQGIRERSTRADNIPHNPDYGTMNLPPGVRVPKKLATPIKVEGKVWLAAERSQFYLYLYIYCLISYFTDTSRPQHGSRI
jgi:hypothetical protein